MFLFGVMLVLTVFVGIAPWRYPKESASSDVAIVTFQSSEEPLSSKIWVLVAVVVAVFIVAIMGISASWPVSPQLTLTLWATTITIGVILSYVFMLISKQNTFSFIQGSRHSVEAKIVAAHGCIDEDLKSMSRTFHEALKSMSGTLSEIIAKNGEETRKTILEAHKSLKEELRK